MITIHWVDWSSGSLKKLLLHVISPVPGNGVGERVAAELFDFLQTLGRHVLSKLQAIVSDNGSDAIKVPNDLRYRINNSLEMDSLKESYLIRCIDHSIQLAVKSALEFIKAANEKLRELCIRLRKSKVKRAAYRKEAQERRLSSLEPPQIDSPTRWNSTHEMNKDALKKKLVLDSVAQDDPDLQEYQLFATDWRRIQEIVQFLTPIRQIMEEGAADASPTISMNQAVYEYAITHCRQVEEKMDSSEFVKCAASAFREKLSSYEAHLIAEPMTVARYLDPRFPKPTDPAQLLPLKDYIRK